VSLRVAVLGAGPGGAVAALRAAQLGADVTLIERADVGGTCLNWGCIPTKALLAGADLLRRIRQAADFGIHVSKPRIDFARMMARKEEIVSRQRAGVEAAIARKRIHLVHGPGVLRDDGIAVGDTRYPYDAAIIAVGTQAVLPPGIDTTNPHVLTSNDVLRLDRLPRSMLVLGGGVVGCEYASLFAALGTRVTIVELLPRLLTGVDERAATYLQRALERDGVRVLTGRQLTDLRTGDAGIAARLDDGTDVSADDLLVAVGRAPQTRGIGLEEAGVVLDERGWIRVDAYLRTDNPRVYAIGDCVGGAQLAHKASAEGHRAAENALGVHPAPMDYTVIPSCIYTHPEIACVGLHAAAAAAAGHRVTTGQARFAGSGKALAEGDAEGFAQIVADAGTGRILGATMVGLHAVEIIHEVAVAMADGLTLDDLGAVIHAHPTVSEVVMDAAQAGEGIAPYLS
jgi:dihydrolipoamide dehydrogenase